MKEREVKTVTQAKTQLSFLLQRVIEGEEIVIGKAGKPVAKIVPYKGTGDPRVPGKLKGRVTMGESFYHQHSFMED
ncbi:MAG: type II toxin-antitoxin system Phd/YefM family antitoxin [Spirochaetaceae bacterium]